MTDEDTKAIRARADAATAGVWTVHEWSGGWHVRGPRGEAVTNIEAEDETDVKMAEDDAAFIAAARTDVPALCDEVDRLRDWQGTALSMGWAPATSPEAAEWRNRIDAMQREYLAEVERLRAALTNVCGECGILVRSDGSATHNSDHLTMTLALARIWADARAALEGGER